jgi:hypothetical protein
MEFTTIYRNGKPERFFIKLDDPKEFAFLRPYYLATTSDKTRFGSILEMECLFSQSVWQGRQRHGCGYSCSADVYGSLIRAAEETILDKLEPATVAFLNGINTHDDKIEFPADVLDDLDKASTEALLNKLA